MNDKEGSQPENSIYILNFARWIVVIGSIVGLGVYKSAEIATKLSPELDADVIRVIGLGFIGLTTLGYFSGVNATKNPFTPED